MQTFSKIFLSGSSTGVPISITNTATPGNSVHSADGAAIDEIWLYAMNNDTENVTVTVEFGDTSPSSLIVKTISPQDGLVCLVPGLIQTDGNNIAVFASTAGVVSICGFVNRITGV